MLKPISPFLLMRFSLAAWALAALPACTSVQVRPVPASMALSHVCIVDNPRVWVDDFQGVLRDGLGRHGVSSEVCAAAAPPPGRCEYLLTYTATRDWDFAPYLSDAEIRIEKGGLAVGAASYHLVGGGGLSLYKWQGTRTKIDPLIDALLGAHAP